MTRTERRTCPDCHRRVKHTVWVAIERKGDSPFSRRPVRYTRCQRCGYEQQHERPTAKSNRVNSEHGH